MGHEGRISGNAGSLEKMDDVDQKRRQAMSRIAIEFEEQLTPYL
jgi:hypothetical protein